MLVLNANTVKVSVLALVLPVMLVHVTPPSVLTCHCTLGDGLPVAVAVNEA